MLPLVKDLKGIDKLIIRENVPLAPLTTFKVGGSAPLFLLPCSLKALEQTLDLLKKNVINFKMLGKGSNLIVEKPPSVVLSLSKLKKIRKGPKGIEVFSGVTIGQLIAWCLSNNIGGLEPLAGIPGSLGGAIHMNAGACGKNIGNFLKEVLISTENGSQWIKTSKDMFKYRCFTMDKTTVIAGARITFSSQRAAEEESLFPQDMRTGSKIIRKIMRKRLDSQPVGSRSAGCIFKNPEITPAWKLISQCGLRGFSVNDAQISVKHANFIINRGNATPQDIIKLINIAKERVLKKTGVTLKEEVIIWQ